MVKIKVQSTNQIYPLEIDNELNPGQEILIESEGVIESAIVMCGKNCPKEQERTEEKTINFVRSVSEEERNQLKDNKELAKTFITPAKEKVFRHGLTMKILGADLSFDQKKLTLYFSADGRIDFRSLVSDMAGDFGKIIRLQQVGVRDEARLSGGFGKCGRELCCARFINNLESVPLEAAEAQDKEGIKPAMVTGCCGKLMCCLSFEEGNNIRKPKSEVIK